MSSVFYPTKEAYGELQQAYDFFNEELFQGELPSCLITLQREKATFGYFSAKRFGSIQGGFTDEIAMNPTYFAAVPLLETMQTLAHEMCHLWQHHFGKPGRVRYHNDEWANKMEAIGLMPSSTGQPGGRRTGDRMADYAIEGGRFLEAAKRLITQDFRISWYDRFGPSNLQAMTQNLVSAQVSSALGLPAAPGRLQHAGQAGDQDTESPTAAAGAPIVVHVPAQGRIKRARSSTPALASRTYGASPRCCSSAVSAASTSRQAGWRTLTLSTPFLGRETSQDEARPLYSKALQR